MNTNLQTSMDPFECEVKKTYILRQYQNDGIHKINEKWDEGIRSILFQSPSGTGKTVLFSEIARLCYTYDRKILIVVHRKELVEQAKDKLLNNGVDAGIIMAGVLSDYTKSVQIASIQTLMNREHPEAEFIIIDEAHHAKATTYRKLWDMYPNAKFLGVTATPIRLNGEGFEDIFNELIVSDSIQKFISGGFLVPVDHYVGSIPELSKIKLRGGDYENFPLSIQMMKKNILADLVSTYKDKCHGKSTIVFAVNIDHSKQIVASYNRNGISAAHIDATTSTKEREQIISDFKNKKIQVVSNVEIITEGFDFPECEVVQLARPTKSLSLYLQMVGRVLRPSEGKLRGLVLDHANLWLEHGLSTINRNWSLIGLGKQKKVENEIKVCAIKQNGDLKKVYLDNLAELKGMKLVPLTDEYQRLLVFQGKLWFAIRTNLKLLFAYNFYKNYLNENGLTITYREFEYIKKRLNQYNGLVKIENRFNVGFWYYESRNLGFTNTERKEPILEQTVVNKNLHYAD